MRNKICDADVAHGIWMLEHQLNNVADFARFWLIYGRSVRDCPNVEIRRPWQGGLEEAIRNS